MKHTARKLLSLLMVLAMLLTMVPAAFAMAASDFEDWDDWDAWEDYVDEYELDDLSTSMLKNVTIDWDEDECEELEDDHPSKPKNDEDEILEIIDWDNVDDYADLDYFDWNEDDLEDFFVPPTCGDDNEGIIGVACTECGAWGYIELPDLHDWDDEPIDYDEDDDEHELECLECEETEWFDCDCSGDCDYLDENEDDEDEENSGYVEVDADDDLLLSVDDDTDGGFYTVDEEDIWVYIEADVDDKDDYTYKFVWSGDGTLDKDAELDDDESELLVDTSGETAEITCKVTATSKDGKTKYEGEVTWTLELQADVVVEVVAYNDTEYVFGAADEEGNDSVVDQMIVGVEDLDDEYTFEYVQFDDAEFDGGELNIKTSYKYFDEDAEDYDEDEKKHALLSEVEFTPEEDFEGTVSIDVTVYYYNDKDKLRNTTGTINIEVKEGGAGLGIVLTGKAGKEIAIDEDLFYDFWEEEFEDGELEKVKFTSVSKGKLYYDYDGDDETSLSGKTCYDDPTSKQMGLENLTYVPAKNTTTAVIEFTASGENDKGKAKSAEGTITILFVDGDIEPIAYEYTGSAITLDADDFIDLYKDVMDVTRASNLQIQFLEVPANGTLYYNYSAKTGKGTALTERTVGTFKFSSSTSAARSIEDVTYVPGTKSTGDTVKFACYSGSSLKFLGTVEFGKADPIKLTKISSTNGVTFTVADFFSNKDFSAYSISFGTPTSGTLYVNYNGTTGTKVTSGMKFYAFSAAALGYYNISTVTFVPATSGKATVPFTAVAADGKTTVEGTVEVTTVVNRFPDLKNDHWAFDHIMKLVGMGVVGGDDKGNVNPDGTITYGEVLKIVMKAAGYADQKATGTHWASGYLTKAVADGLIGANTDLNAKADRNAVATLTGKALKLTQASSVKAGIAAPIDSNNGYVYALYNAGILTGSNVNGVNYFKGGDNISRAEAFTIVSRVYDYVK